VLLKVLGMWALVLLELVLGPGFWLALSIFASQPSTSANCSLVLLLWWDFDCKWVKEVGLLEVKLVAGLVAEVFYQLESLSAGMILRLGPGWIVHDRNFRDDQPFWWICLEYCGVFGRYVRLLLKHKMVLKGVPGSGTGIDIEELW